MRTNCWVSRRREGRISTTGLSHPLSHSPRTGLNSRMYTIVSQSYYTTSSVFGFKQYTYTTEHFRNGRLHFLFTLRVLVIRPFA
jgi:hypothetical protein